MADQKVNIDIRTKGAKKAKDNLGGLNGSIAKMGRAVGIASAAYFGARGLINAFSSTIELAGIQEQAEKKLETALGKTSQALLNQASALQKVTTFGDEAIIEVQASIAAFEDNEEAIKKATEATLDIAVAMGMDLKSAGDLVAKTLGSSTNAMSRYGIEVTGAVGSTERLESLTGNVARLFGGQATAQAQTMAGALQQAKNSSGDLAEAIGEKLSPLVKSLATNFQMTTEQLTELINPTVLTRQDELNLLLESARGLRLDETEAIKEQVISVDDLFNSLQGIDEFTIGLTEEQGQTALEAIDKQIKAYDDLIFKKQVALEITRSSQDGEIDFGQVIQKVADNSNVSYNEIIGTKNKMMQQDLKNAALSGQTAKQAMKSVVRAEAMEAVAGYISSVLKTVPFPANLILAAGGGAAVSGLIDRGLAAFADGGVVQGNPSTGDSVPAMLTPGEVILNASQQQGLLNNMGGVTVNIQGNMIGNEEFVRDTLIPEIDRTVNRGLA